MNPVELVLKARAAELGRVQPRRRLRHIHVEEAPLAIAAMQMAGEPHALWGALVGTNPHEPRLIVAPEPRNRDIAFAALADFADVICDVVDRCGADRVQVQHKSAPATWRCRTAPQLLVANRAVVDLLDRLGRRMRPAGYGGHVSVPPNVNLAGAHLGFVAESARHPGSALALIATKELARQAVTGQSALEDAHLGALLAWWDPAHLERIQPGVLGGRDPTTLHGAEAARAIEDTPMSVLTDPRVDTTRLVDAVTEFNRARVRATDRLTVERFGHSLRDELHAALLPTWNALWIAHDVLGWMPEAPSVSERWEGDLIRFTRHVDYLASGGRRASVDSPKRAAMLLADWERDQAALERSEVLEDPLAMAAALAQGQAIRGRVRSLDADHMELREGGKRLVARPLITLECEDPCPFPVGSELWWTCRPGLAAQVIAGEPHGTGTRVTLKVTAGMKGDLPPEGETAIFSVFNTNWVPPAGLPAETPWTHVPDADRSAREFDLDGAGTAEDAA